MNKIESLPPALFLSHGSPDLPVRESQARSFLSGLGRQLGSPRAVVMMSAHWGSRSPLVGTARQYESTIDFYGFPAEIGQLSYRTVGEPELAQHVLSLLDSAGLDGSPQERTMLDHGVWQPLMLMYPNGIPLVQLSVQPRFGPDRHYELGRALAALRRDGVLVVGSGSATHNLRQMEGHLFDSAPPEWVKEFDFWLADAIARRDLAALLNYREQAPFAIQNHPTEEHLLPLFFALGAAGDDWQGQLLHSSFTYGVISMAAYAFR